MGSMQPAMRNGIKFVSILIVIIRSLVISQICVVYVHMFCMTKFYKLMFFIAFMLHQKLKYQAKTIK